MPRIMKNFAQTVVAKVSAAQAPASKKSTADHMAAIEKIVGKNFRSIGVGEGVVLPIPKDVKAGNFLAGLRGKLVPATREGGPIPGQVFKMKVRKATESEPEALLFWREEDLAEPNKVKTGGRKAGTPNKPKETVQAKAGETVVAGGETDTKPSNSISDAKAAAQAHLGTAEGPKQEPEVQKAASNKPKGGKGVKDLTAGKQETATA